MMKKKMIQMSQMTLQLEGGERRTRISLGKTLGRARKERNSRLILI